MTKVGFIEPKWHRPIYHDPVEVFTSFRVAKTSDAAMMQLILGKTGEKFALQRELETQQPC